MNADIGARTRADVGAQLRAEVEQSAKGLVELLRHRELLGDDVPQLSAQADRVTERLARTELEIAVCGEMKVGKTTFLNAILGVPLLTAQAMEATAAATRITWSSSPDYRAEFVDATTETFVMFAPDREPELNASIRRVDELARASEDAVVRIRARRMAEEQRRIEAATAVGERFSAVREAETLADAADGALTTSRADLAERAFNSKQALSVLPGFLRGRPSRWRVWSWAARALAGWAWRRARHEAVDAEVRVARSRAASEAAELVANRAAERRTAETHQLAAARATLTAAESSIAQLGAELAALEDGARALVDRRSKLNAERDVHARERTKLFAERIAELTDIARLGRRVRSVEVRYPAAHLPPGLALVDTPGVNTSDEELEARAYAAIERDADGCVVLCNFDAGHHDTTSRLIERIVKHVPHVVFVTTMFDRALENAEGTGNASAEKQVQASKKKIEQKLAKLVGRQPGSLRVFHVAARPALAGEPVAAAAFAQEVANLIALLREERTIVLAARAAQILRDGREAVARALPRAERAYAERVATLEAQRMPDLDAFVTTRVREIEPRIKKRAGDLADSAAAQFRAHANSLLTHGRNVISGCGTRAALKPCITTLETQIPIALGNLHETMQDELARACSDAVGQLAAPLIAALDERYRIVERATISSIPRISFSGSPSGRLAVAAVPRPAMTAHLDAGRLSTGAAGAAAGAIVGHLIFPGLGLLTAGAGAWLADQFGGLESTKQACIQQLAATIEGASRTYAEQLAIWRTEITEHLSSIVRQTLHERTAAFAHWIEHVMVAEQTAIDTTRAAARQLEAVGVHLSYHNERLEALLAEARGVSDGLVHARAP